MTNQSMFGELAIRLPHPEDFATKALHFILSTHAAAWPAFRTFLGPTALKLPDRLTFKTQKGGDDAAVPDLVGSDREGGEVLIVEAKFWAALTDNQPVVYLRRLPPKRHAVLLVLAPAARLGSLWQELGSRCRDARLTLAQGESRLAEFKVASLAPGHVLALASWHALLSFMIRDAEARGARALAEDVAQLNGLCARMDGEGFLPVRGSELAPEIGRRVLQFAHLVDSVVLDELVPNRGASKKDAQGGKGELKTGGGGRDMHGRYFFMKGLACFFCYSPLLWAQHGHPMWLCVMEKDWASTGRLRERLDQYALESDSLVVEPYKDESYAYVPIKLPTGVEKAAVIASIVEQIASILETCQPVAKRPGRSLTK